MPRPARPLALFCTSLTLALCCFVPGDALQAQPAAAPAKQVATTIDSAIRLLSYNVRVENNPEAWERRRATVANVLNSAPFDIVAMQEASELMLTDYQAALPDSYYVVGERSDGHRGNQSWYEFNPIFFNAARFEKLDAGSIWVGENPARPGDTLDDSKPHGRVFTWAILRDRATGKRIAVGNVHIHGAQAERAVELLVDTLRDKADGAPILLLGDFNSTPDTAAYQRMVSAEGFNLRDAGQLAPGSVTTIGAGQSVPEGQSGAKEGSVGKRIDYVFTDKAFTASDYRLVDSVIEGGSYASDHFPIAATVQLAGGMPLGFVQQGETQAIASGVSFARYIRAGAEPQVAQVITLDLTDPALRFAVTPADRSGGLEYRAMLTTDFVEDSGAAVAVNASYFLPFKGGSKGGDDYFPHIGDAVGASGASEHMGQTVSPVEPALDERVNVIACFDGPVLFMADGQTCPDGYPESIAVGPRLLKAGVEQSYDAFGIGYATKRHPRASLGVAADGKTAWILVVDGRQADYSVGASLHELAEIFLSLGASDAMNLDGGGSTTLAATIEGEGTLLNRPIHTGVPGRERPVANQIAVFAAPLPEEGN